MWTKINNKALLLFFHVYYLLAIIIQHLLLLYVPVFQLHLTIFLHCLAMMTSLAGFLPLNQLLWKQNSHSPSHSSWWNFIWVKFIVWRGHIWVKSKNVSGGTFQSHSLFKGGTFESNPKSFRGNIWGYNPKQRVIATFAWISTKVRMSTSQMCPLK